MTRIEISAEKPENFKVLLVGKEYIFHPPKSIFTMRIGAKLQEVKDPLEQLDIILEWFKGVLTPTSHKALMKRLEDPTDALDLGHLMDVFTQVVEKVAGNPTT